MPIWRTLDSRVFIRIFDFISWHLLEKRWPLCVWQARWPKESAAVVSTRWNGPTSARRRSLPTPCSAPSRLLIDSTRATTRWRRTTTDSRWLLSSARRPTRTANSSSSSLTDLLRTLRYHVPCRLLARVCVSLWRSIVFVQGWKT